MLDAELLVGRYRLVERLGTSRASTVWRAYDEVLQRPVAVKLLDDGRAGDAVSRRQVRSQATALARVFHPNLTRVYDYGELMRPDRTWISFVVTELVDGPTLADLLAGEPLPWRTAVRICAEVASGLAAAHTAGVVHRDVEPANVIVTDGGVKLVDFGAVAGGAGTAGDVYALGVLLREVLDRHPHPESDLTGLVRRCLDDAPARRPTSTEIAATLAATARTGPVVAAELDPPPAPATLPALEFGDWDLADLLGPPTLILPVAEPVPVPDTAEVRSPAVPIPMATGPRRPARRRRTGRAVLVATAAVVAGLAATGYPQLGSNAGEAGWIAAGPGPAGAGVATCGVRYETRRDAAGTFDVDLTLNQRTPRSSSGWTLSFTFPADQRLDSVAGAPWNQIGPTVTFHQGADPAATIRLRLAGTYGASNPLPTAFTLDGTTCRAVVTGATADDPAIMAISAADPPRLMVPTYPRSTAPNPPRTPTPGASGIPEPAPGLAGAPVPVATPTPTPTAVPPTTRPTVPPVPPRPPTPPPTPLPSTYPPPTHTPPTHVPPTHTPPSAPPTVVPPAPPPPPPPAPAPPTVAPPTRAPAASAPPRSAPPSSRPWTGRPSSAVTVRATA